MKRNRHKNQRSLLFGKGKRYEPMPGEEWGPYAGHRSEAEDPGVGTVGATPTGAPRSLDFRNFDAVDWSLCDEAEDFS